MFSKPELKWSPIKQYPFYAPQGKQGTSDLLLEVLPHWRDFKHKAPVPFAIMITIRDPKRQAPVYNDVTQLLNQSFITEDIRTKDIPAPLTIIKK